MNSVEVSTLNYSAGADTMRAVEFAADAALELENRAGACVSIVLTDNENIHRYNMDYRGVDRPTDVLSFPTAEGESLFAPPDGFIGDIIISVPKAYEQAEQLGHSPERELMFLTVHGVLHLLGYDHMNQSDETVMLTHQRTIMEEILRRYNNEANT